MHRRCSSGSNIFDEPFILATQATQVYYVQDSIEKDWYVVVHPPARDFFDMDARIDGHDDVHLQETSLIWIRKK